MLGTLLRDYRNSHAGAALPIQRGFIRLMVLETMQTREQRAHWNKRTRLRCGVSSYYGRGRIAFTLFPSSGQAWHAAWRGADRATLPFTRDPYPEQKSS